MGTGGHGTAHFFLFASPLDEPPALPSELPVVREPPLEVPSLEPVLEPRLGPVGLAGGGGNSCVPDDSFDLLLLSESPFLPEPSGSGLIMGWGCLSLEASTVTIFTGSLSLDSLEASEVFEWPDSSTLLSDTFLSSSALFAL